MDQSGVVVLRYNVEKWHEAVASHSDSASASTSPSKVVTLSYRKDRLGTPTPRLLPVPWLIKAREEPARVVKKPVYDANEPYITRSVEDSLIRLRKYGESFEKFQKNGHYSPFLYDRSALDKNWYHDATNVAQRLRFLRDTYKVLQAVRKKRAMGERVDFKTAHEAKSRSRTGSPAPLDEDHQNLGNEEHKVEVVAAPRRGRPRKRGGVRGRKPGPRLRVGLVTAPVGTRSRRGRPPNQPQPAPVPNEATNEEENAETKEENVQNRKNDESAGNTGGVDADLQPKMEPARDSGMEFMMEADKLRMLESAVEEMRAEESQGVKHYEENYGNQKNYGNQNQDHQNQEGNYGAQEGQYPPQSSYDTSMLTNLDPSQSSGGQWGPEIMVPELMPLRPDSGRQIPPTGFENDPSLWNSQPFDWLQNPQQAPEIPQEGDGENRQDPASLSELTMSIIENLKRRNPSGLVLASLYGRPGGLSFAPQWHNEFLDRDGGNEKREPGSDLPWPEGQ